ncbi:MAG TPA: hypothetical protein VJ508_18945, partial [Saprospiraceae bacterium]|nr:hypothetical protein [Saprospiraceae bacterium]
MNLLIRYILLSIVLCLFFLATSLHAQSVAINNTNSLPDPSALLDLSSSYKGLLIPRVNLINTTDPVTISSPARGLLVYNLGANIQAGFYYNAGTPGLPDWTIF